MPKVLIDNINLHYEIKGQGQPLVFIHGLGSSTQDWQRQVVAFSPDYRVIVFDLRGHGQSDKPAGPYTVPLFAADTAGLLKALGIETAHIVGVSLGGAVAFQLALDYPTLVRTLTIVNSAPAPAGSDEDIEHEIARRVAIVRQLGMRAMGEALSPNLFPRPEHENLRRDFVERWAQNDQQAYIEATRSLAGWNVLDKIGTIKCPTLVISADHDYTPVAAKEDYVKLMPDAKLAVINDAHHATPLEAPEEFNAVLRTFLGEHR